MAARTYRGSAETINPKDQFYCLIWQQGWSFDEGIPIPERLVGALRSTPWQVRRDWYFTRMKIRAIFHAFQTQAGKHVLFFWHFRKSTIQATSRMSSVMYSIVFPYGLIVLWWGWYHFEVGGVFYGKIFLLKYEVFLHCKNNLKSKLNVWKLWRWLKIEV